MAFNDNEIRYFFMDQISVRPIQIYIDFFSLKIAENGFWQLIPRHNFWTKRAISFCHILPLKRQRLSQHCHYWCFEMSSKVKYFLFSNSNKIKKRFKKELFYSLMARPFLHALLMARTLRKYFFCGFPSSNYFLYIHKKL